MTDNLVVFRISNKVCLYLIINLVGIAVSPIRINHCFDGFRSMMRIWSRCWASYNLKKRISDKKKNIKFLSLHWNKNLIPWSTWNVPAVSFWGSICTPSYRVYYSMYVSTLFIFLFFWFSALRHYDKKHDDFFLIRRVKTILTNLILQYLTS